MGGLIYRFGDFSLDSERYELARDGAPLALEPRPLEVLAYLVAHRDRVVAKEELIERLWEGRFVSDSALTRAVREARRALGDDGAAERWIKTVYGRGYLFAGEVEELAAGGEEGGEEGRPAGAGGEGGGEVVQGGARDGGAAERSEPAAAPASSPSAPAVGVPPSAAPPLPLAPLIGRARELGELRRLLGSARLLTVTGAPGTGKTRLTLEVARAAAADFPGGVGWVSLADVRDPEAVLPEVARALRVPDRPGRDPADGLAAHLGDGRILLVLDNLEQVLAAAPRLADLLRRAPRLALLVTSRFVLGVTGEQELPLAPLAAPAEGERDAAALAASPAVTLFLDRARAARPGLVADGDTLAAVAELARRLDGLPLALELAAARVKLMTPAEILARLGSRLDLLASRTSDRPTRHQTLRQALDWSLDLLSGEEAACLARLSVFAGGFHLDAAAAVACGGEGGEGAAGDAGEGALGLLAALVDKSLVERLGSGPGGSRFTLLETTREIAGERLAADPAAETATRRAHARWCRTLAERAEPALAGGDGQVEWLARLDVEHANLLAALDFAVGSGELEDGLATAGAMWRWWSARGVYREGFERLRALVDHPAAAGGGAAVAAARLRALTALGAMAFLLCDFATAKRRLGEGLELALARGDRAAEAGLLTHLGWAHGESGDLDTGEEQSRRALALHRETGDLRGAAAALNNLGWQAVYRDDPEAARRFLEESLALRREAGDLRGEIMALVTLSWCRRSQEALPERRALLAEARRLAARLDDRPLASYTLSGEGILALDAGDPAEAVRLLTESGAFFRQVGHALGVAFYLTHAAEAQLAAGDGAAAARLLDEADPLWAEIGNRWGERMAAELRARLPAGSPAGP